VGKIVVQPEKNETLNRSAHEAGNKRRKEQNTFLQKMASFYRKSVFET